MGETDISMIDGGSRPSAASLILSATPTIIFYLVLQKYIIKGIAAGAMKG